ncbi:hypothetical protein GS399_01200 [Pedobacter sp. HMF7647]|uniref:TonB C-terminal domain-containing protein n=1 Tax=Hufsiella arboris TaxID=2695275 RepID=A0A7K1Y4R7_9SPHI|nr:energy transducer TonB [Hufsiella arboris]MXV49573.1 hypothetical protein [Hufsiella arboris]
MQGKLDPETAHAVEKAALDDPFLADAIEGFSENGQFADHSDLSLLQKRLENRIAQNHHIRNVQGFTWQRISIAATAGLLFLVASVLYLMNSQKNRDRQLAATQKQVDVTLTHPDSLDESVAAIEPEEKINTAPQTDVRIAVTEKNRLPKIKNDDITKPVATITSTDSVINNSPQVAVAEKKPETTLRAFSKAAVVSDSVISKPVPVIGWDKYSDYLAESKKLPAAETAKGKVTIGFTVNSSGLLDDFTIIQGVNDVLNNEALRLIKEGPAWKPSSANAKDSKVMVTVTF